MEEITRSLIVFLFLFHFSINTHGDDFSQWNEQANEETDCENSPSSLFACLLRVTDAVELFYELSESKSLPRFRHDQELLWLLNGELFVVTATRDGRIVFPSAGYLAELGPEDIIALALYRNNDPDILLWDLIVSRAMGLATDRNRDGKTRKNEGNE